MKLAHIGIAVRSLKDSVPVFEKIFNVKANDEEFVEGQKVKVRKLRLKNCDIELLEGTNGDSPITKFIEKKGEGIHHLSFSVDDIQSTLNKIKKEGLKLVNKFPTRGADDMTVAFLHPKTTSNVLIEFVESLK